MTIVTVVSGGVLGGGTKRLIGKNYIVCITPGSKNTCAVVLSNGDTFNTKETYDEMKKMIGIE